MKSRIMFAAMLLASTHFVRGAVAQQKQTISKSEVKGLLASATSPQDHQKLAAYYAQEAGRLTTEAQKHDEEAVTREKNPNYFAVKNPAAFGAQHCRNFAADLRKDAAKAQSLAESHQEMARQAAQ